MVKPSAAAKLISSISQLNAFRDLVITTRPLSECTKFIAACTGEITCDNVLAVSLLKLLPEFNDHAIFRCDDVTLMKRVHCDALIDVGSDLNVKNYRIVFHKYNCLEKWNDRYSTFLSSAGLVFKKYGRDIIQIISQFELPSFNISPVNLSEDTIELVYNKIYGDFMEHIDELCNENNAPMCPSELNYDISTTLVDRVKILNPQWNHIDRFDECRFHEQYKEAMTLTLSEFVQTTLNCLHVWLPAREIVQKSIQDRFQVHSSGQIIYLSQYCPWSAHLYDLEKTMIDTTTEKQILYVLFRENEHSVRVQAVNEKGSFELRKSLKKEWLGLRNQELSSVSGIAECIFAHKNGFIGGNGTYDGALEMAIQSVNA